MNHIGLKSPLQNSTSRMLEAFDLKPDSKKIPHISPRTHALPIPAKYKVPRIESKPNKKSASNKHSQNVLRKHHFAHISGVFDIQTDPLSPAPYFTSQNSMHKIHSTGPNSPMEIKENEVIKEIESITALTGQKQMKVLKPQTLEFQVPALVNSKESEEPADPYTNTGGFKQTLPLQQTGAQQVVANQTSRQFIPTLSVQHQQHNQTTLHHKRIVKGTLPQEIGDTGQEFGFMTLKAKMNRNEKKKRQSVRTLKDNESALLKQKSDNETENKEISDNQTANPTDDYSAQESRRTARKPVKDLIENQTVLSGSSVNPEDEPDEIRIVSRLKDDNTDSKPVSHGTPQLQSYTPFNDEESVRPVRRKTKIKVEGTESILRKREMENMSKSRYTAQGEDTTFSALSTNSKKLPTIVVQREKQQNYLASTRKFKIHSPPQIKAMATTFLRQERVALDKKRCPNIMNVTFNEEMTTKTDKMHIDIAKGESFKSKAGQDDKNVTSISFKKQKVSPKEKRLSPKTKKSPQQRKNFVIPKKDITVQIQNEEQAEAQFTPLTLSPLKADPQWRQKQKLLKVGYRQAGQVGQPPKLAGLGSPVAKKPLYEMELKPRYAENEKEKDEEIEKQKASLQVSGTEAKLEDKKDLKKPLMKKSSQDHIKALAECSSEETLYFREKPQVNDQSRLPSTQMDRHIFIDQNGSMRHKRSSKLIVSSPKRSNIQEGSPLMKQMNDVSKQLRQMNISPQAIGEIQGQALRIETKQSDKKDPSPPMTRDLIEVNPLNDHMQIMEDSFDDFGEDPLTMRNTFSKIKSPKRQKSQARLVKLKKPIPQLGVTPWGQASPDNMKKKKKLLPFDHANLIDSQIDGTPLPDFDKLRTSTEGTQNQSNSNDFDQ